MKNFIQKIFIEKRSLIRLVFFLFFDLVLISLSSYLAFLLRFEGKIPHQYFLNIQGVILLASIITIPIFYFSKLYSFSWLYVSTEELISLAKAVALSSLILAAAFLILRDVALFTGFPRSTLFITYFFIFIFCGGMRFAKRIYSRIFSSVKKEEKEKALIVGAGDAGEQILRSIQNSKNSPYLPIGFIDDSPAKQGILIHGMKVFGKIEDIPKVVKEKTIEDLIIALPSAGSKPIKMAVEKGRKAGLKKIKIVPSIQDVIDGQVHFQNLREVEMEDLLGREPVSLDQNSIAGFLQNKKVLITGAAGSIGSELCRQVAKFKPLSLLVLDRDETGIFNISKELEDKFPKLKIGSLIADIQNEGTINKIFDEFHPQVVFHAAAYKHVPLMEMFPEEAVKNNIFGLKTMAFVSFKQKVEKFIFISTDKAVNPSSVMGASKRMGEMICQDFNQKNDAKFISVRFGNVLNSRGSVVPIFKEQIKKGGPVEVTHPEMKRYFMTTPEACLLVMQAGAMGQGGEVFVLDMGSPIKIVDLAKELIRLSGLEPDKDIPLVFTQPRPGEKFFEEILTAEEGTIKTQNQKIFIAQLPSINQKKLKSGLKKLKAAADFGDRKNIIKILREVIPNYNPKTSVKIS